MLNSVENIKEFINYLPNLIIYVAPGYIIICIISFIIQRKQLRDKGAFFQYIVFSYVIKIITEVFLENKITNKTNLMFAIISVSIISGVCIGIFIKSNKFNKFLKILKINLTIYSNIFDDIDDKEYGVLMRFHLEDGKNIYEGLLRKYENTNNFDDIHIMLSEYIKYKNQDDDTTKVIDDFSNDPTAWIVLRAKDIKSIEVFYDKRSEIVEKEEVPQVNEVEESSEN